MVPSALFAYLFPPPAYMTLRSVGIDISDTSVKYVRFEKPHLYDRTLRMLAWGDIALPPGAIVDGDIKDIDAVSTILKEVRVRSKVSYARLSLPEERAYLFETNVPADTPMDEIRGLLEFKLEENVPLAPQDAYFDYDLVGSISEETKTVAVTVYAKETIRTYFDACMKADIIPVSFEVEAAAIARAVIPSGESGAQMIIDFGRTRTGIGIVYEGTLMHASTIETGGEELSQAMRTVVGEIPESEITNLKNTEGLLASGMHANLRAPLLVVVQRIVTEVEARIAYWNNRERLSHERNIESVITCGGSANLRGLREFLEGRLNIPVRHADVWQNTPLPKGSVPEIEKRSAYGYATAIGLARTESI